jgi:hypothetical protein
LELSRPCAACRWLSAHGHVVSFNLKKRQRLLQISTVFYKLTSVSPPYYLLQTGVVVIDKDNEKVESSYICHYRASLQLRVLFLSFIPTAPKSRPRPPKDSGITLSILYCTRTRTGTYVLYLVRSDGWQLAGFFLCTVLYRL